MKGFVLIAVSLLVVAFLFFGSAFIADGWYDLTVEVSPEIAEGVSQVSYLCANDAEMADAITASIDEQLRFMEHQTTAGPFTVSVGFSFRGSALGPTWGHVQEYSHIVVVLDYADGSRVVHRLGIPHREESKLIVVLPASATQ